MKLLQPIAPDAASFEADTLMAPGEKLPSQAYILVVKVHIFPYELSGYRTVAIF